ncbi:MAG TPA: glycosyltransferase [Chloroflexota bacterium]|nr:glycosyltransferase [Chloroflexota bacterium]
MTTLGLLAGLTLLLGLVAWRAREFLTCFEPISAEPRPAPRLPAVTVVIPARNEAANIARCVRSVLAQDYPALRVVVVDDNSTDATPQILAALAAADPRLSVVRGRPLPPGWTGKNFALAQAAPYLHGEWVLFLDADTWLEPGAIRAAVLYAAERHLGLLSLVPRQHLLSFWERVLQPVVLLVIALALPLRRMADPRHPRVAYANGQFLLVRRAAYEKVGGHAARRDAVVEDCALARAVKQAGYRVQLADGRALAHIRMYRGLGELWEGWSKNSFLSAGRRLRNVALLLLAVTAVCFAPPWLALSEARALLAGGGAETVLLTAVALLQVAGVLYLGWRCLREVGVPAWFTLALPLGALLFNALLCYSAYRVLSGRGVAWKGRVYVP